MSIEKLLETLEAIDIAAYEKALADIQKLVDAVEWAERNYRAVMLDYDGTFLEAVDKAMRRMPPDHPIYSRK